MAFQCTVWRDNREPFGCTATPMDPLLESLCDNPKINAGGNNAFTIEVFRGGKKWEFDNKPEPKKPFGNLLSAAVPAKKVWKGIKFPGGFGHNNEKPVMVYNNTWSQWLNNGDPDINEDPILDMDDSPGVAVLLPFDRVAVVVKDKVWYFRKKGKVIYRDSEDNGPFDVKDTPEKFPPDLGAALTFNQNVYYFFRGNKYCKRPIIVDKDSLRTTSKLDWNNMRPSPEETDTQTLPPNEVFLSFISFGFH